MNLPPLGNRETCKPGKPGKPGKPAPAVANFSEGDRPGTRMNTGFPGFPYFPYFPRFTGLQGGQK